VVERRQRFAVFGLQSAQYAQQLRFVSAATAVLGDHQTAAKGVQAALDPGASARKAEGQQ
jgi:hypothetical protein